MTRLERLGLEVAAAVWMETPLTEGRLLACLLTQPDRIVSWTSLDELMKSPVRTRGCHRIASAEHGRVRVRAYISRIRTALDDLGYGAAIQTVPGAGYQMPRQWVAPLRAAIEAAI